ncbi:DUF2267 domain-containing protein [Hydrogenimonas sp.]
MKKEGAINFEKDLQKANEFLKDLAVAVGCEGDEKRAGRILRSVLRVLRRRISAEQYMDLVSQLPMCIKGVAVDGWRLSASPDKSIRSVEAFVQAVVAEDGNPAQNDFGDPAEAEEIVKRCFHFLKERIAPGEIADIEAELPGPIQDFLKEA